MLGILITKYCKIYIVGLISTDPNEKFCSAIDKDRSVLVLFSNESSWHVFLPPVASIYLPCDIRSFNVTQLHCMTLTRVSELALALYINIALSVLSIK